MLCYLSFIKQLQFLAEQSTNQPLRPVVALLLLSLFFLRRRHNWLLLWVHLHFTSHTAYIVPVTLLLLGFPRIFYLFKNSHFEWSEKEEFSSRFDFTISIWVFNFLTNSLLSSKDLLNFQTPDTRAKLSFITKKQKMGEWSDDRAFRTSVVLTDSCKLLETKI